MPRGRDNDQYNAPKVFGALFENDRKTSRNAPDFKGTIELSSEAIEELMRLDEDGKAPILDIAVWWKTPQHGGDEYLSMSAEAKEDWRDQKRGGGDRGGRSGGGGRGSRGRGRDRDGDRGGDRSRGRGRGRGAREDRYEEESDDPVTEPENVEGEFDDDIPF